MRSGWRLSKGQSPPSLGGHWAPPSPAWSAAKNRASLAYDPGSAGKTPPPAWPPWRAEAAPVISSHLVTWVSRLVKICHSTAEDQNLKPHSTVPGWLHTVVLPHCYWGPSVRWRPYTRNSSSCFWTDPQKGPQTGQHSPFCVGDSSLPQVVAHNCPPLSVRSMGLLWTWNEAPGGRQQWKSQSCWSCGCLVTNQL
jgi:hypothetical protein